MLKALEMFLYRLGNDWSVYNNGKCDLEKEKRDLRKPVSDHG